MWLSPEDRLSSIAVVAHRAGSPAKSYQHNDRQPWRKFHGMVIEKASPLSYALASRCRKGPSPGLRDYIVYILKIVSYQVLKGRSVHP